MADRIICLWKWHMRCNKFNQKDKRAIPRMNDYPHFHDRIKYADFKSATFFRKNFPDSYKIPYFKRVTTFIFKNTFIHQGCIKWIKSDSEDITKDYHFKWTLFFLFIKESWKVSTKILSSTKVFRIHNKKIICILEWFLKDHVTRKTGGMVLNIQHNIARMEYICKYIKIKHGCFKL